LEAEAAQCAAPGIDPQPLLELKSSMQTLLRARDGRQDEDWTRRKMDCDRRLHRLIAHSCGSDRLAHEILRYDILVDALRDILHTCYAAQRQALAEHLRIIEPLLGRDPQAAAEAMASHIANSASNAVALVFGERPAMDNATPKNRSPRTNGWPNSEGDDA
jgi:DNA-binding GntR family transcriptional regulator